MAEKQRGLGRGLSALLSEAPVSAVAETQEDTKRTDADELVLTPVEQPIEWLVRNPDQPRKLFAEADIEDLASSIREKGVLQPILVRPAPGQPGKFQIIAGERRWRASQKAGLHSVPVVIREFDDIEVLEIGIVENVQRADLNAIEEAQAYRTLMERFGRTQDAVAQVVGKSRSHIANSMRLLNLPESVQDHVLHGRLTSGHARALVTADNAEALAEEIISKGLSVRQAEALAREISKPSAPARRTTDKPHKSDIAALEQQLREATGMSFRLINKGDGGELRISYKTLEQLDEICRRLQKPQG